MPQRGTNNNNKIKDLVDNVCTCIFYVKFKELLASKPFVFTPILFLCSINLSLTILKVVSIA